MDGLDQLAAGGLGLGIILALVFLGLVFWSLFLHIGTAVASIDRRSLGKAIGGTLLCAILAVPLNLLPIIGFILQLFLCPLIVMGLYSTTYGKALVAYLVSLVVPVILFIAVALFAGGAAALTGQAG